MLARSKLHGAQQAIRGHVKHCEADQLVNPSSTNEDIVMTCLELWTSSLVDEMFAPCVQCAVFIGASKYSLRRCRTSLTDDVERCSAQVEQKQQKALAHERDILAELDSQL